MFSKNAVLRAAAVLLALYAWAGPAEAEEKAIRREILALYHGAQEGNAATTRIHRFAEMPLNHLGYVLRYHDVALPLPPVADIQRYAGVITWFVGAVPQQDAYLTWLEQLQGQTDLRMIVLGDLGAVVTQANVARANRVLAQFGLRHAAQYVSPGDGTRLLKSDPGLYEFECRLDAVVPDYPVVEALPAAVKIALQIETPAHVGRRPVTLAAIGPRGGFAAFNFEFCHQGAPLHRGQWLIDPFAFFSAALDAAQFPIPDATTLSGRRIYFSLVHSEGWTNPVETDRNHRAPRMAAEAVETELIAPFPGLAVTVDLRDGDIEKSGRDLARSRALVQRLLEMQHVSRPGAVPVGSRLSRLDATYDSLSNLGPLAIGDGPRIVLTASSDDRAYREGVARSRTGLFSLRETIANSDTPRRLKPANLNFRMSVGAERASLAIMRQHLETMRASKIAPVGAAFYADIVEGFFSARIVATGPNSWRISDRGRLQTVRFDGAEVLAVDLRSSHGVIGSSRHAGSLYVALDDNVPTAVVALTRKPARPTSAAELELVDSRWALSKLTRGAGRLRLDAAGYGPGEFNWRAPPSMTFAVTAERGDALLWTDVVAADREGRLAFRVPVAGVEPLTIQIGPVKR